MLKNYIHIAWRNLTKSKFYSAVNIIGLSTGVAFTLLIAAYVWTQLRVNAALKNADRQYSIQSNWKDPNEGYAMTTLGPLAKSLRDNYPGLVANYYRFDGISSNISKGDNSFREEIAIGDSTLLNMYGFKLLHGDARTALSQIFSVVITSDKAIKFFGKTDVVGQALSIENFAGSKHDFMITGVLKPISKNSVTQLIENYPSHFFISTDNLSFFGRNMDWTNPHIGAFIELQKNVRPKQLEEPIAHLLKLNAPADITADLTPYIVPLSGYYVNTNREKMLYALSGIAFFILLMAVVNFVNMAVSRSATRMREIGIRKVLGGLRRQLILQFLVESVILVFISTFFALLLYMAARGLFSQIMGESIPTFAEFPIYFAVVPIAFVFVIGVIAGLYPAFVLSSLGSIESLKGKLTSIRENIILRKSLVGFQFATAAVAFIGAIIISQQVSLFLNKDLGYNKEYVISSQVPRNWNKAGVDKMENICRQLAGVRGVKGATLSYEIPDGNNGGQAPVFQLGKDSTKSVATQVLVSDEHYLNIYEIPLQAGAFFDGHSLDSGKVILNDTAIKALGYKSAAEAIGRQLRMPGDPTVFTIKGVTKDFHFGSMQQPISPVIFLNIDFATQFRFLSFKMQPGNIATTISALQAKWKALMPGAPFEYKFMDDALRKLYTSELQLKKASYTATILALIIVLLGVIGLVSLSIQKRTREIGIRKILGSSVSRIMLLFMKEFLIVIFIAAIAACPIAYLIMNKWLQAYAYRIEMTAAPFVLSVCMLGIITAVLICLQTIKAANANPVESVRAN